MSDNEIVTREGLACGDGPRDSSPESELDGQSPKVL